LGGYGDQIYNSLKFLISFADGKLYGKGNTILGEQPEQVLQRNDA
jgi:hypothetical protein